jgi:hypothetical protein
MTTERCLECSSRLLAKPKDHTGPTLGRNRLRMGNPRPEFSRRIASGDRQAPRWETCGRAKLIPFKSSSDSTFLTSWHQLAVANARHEVTAVDRKQPLPTGSSRGNLQVLAECCRFLHSDASLSFFLRFFCWQGAEHWRDMRTAY